MSCDRLTVYTIFHDCIAKIVFTAIRGTGEEEDTHVAYYWPSATPLLAGTGDRLDALEVVLLTVVRIGPDDNANKMETI